MDIVEITFSNNEKITVNQDTIIFPIKLVESKNVKHSSKSAPVILGDWHHPHDGFIPQLTSTFAENDFFTVDEEDTYKTTVYKTSAIVSLRQY